MNDNLSREQKERKFLLLREKRIRLARADLWEFCKLLDGDFYTDDKWHLKLLCRHLQDLYQRKKIDPVTHEIITSFMMNLPPRHGKSRTLINFCCWVLGINPKEKILTVSSGDDLATDFSRYTRDMISKTKINNHEIVYSDVFKTQIKKGNASFEKWAVEGSFFTYLGAGFNSSKITGRGFGIIICDDLISGIEVALNELELEKINRFVSGTLFQRKEQGCIEIFNMTRWHKKDPCGVILSDPDLAKYWEVFKLAVKDKDGKLICESIFNEKQYQRALKEINELVFNANYFQEPPDIKGQLYHLESYDSLPSGIEKIIAFGDTADQGKDYLSIPVGAVKDGIIYILDWYYTQDSVEITENETVSLLKRNKVSNIKIESNSGGRSFALNIQRKLRENNINCSVEWFHQNENKLGRILVNSGDINRKVLLPESFRFTHNEVYKALHEFQKAGKNKHDDAPDSLTGLYEMAFDCDPFAGIN